MREREIASGCVATTSASVSDTDAHADDGARKIERKNKQTGFGRSCGSRHRRLHARRWPDFGWRRCETQ